MKKSLLTLALITSLTACEKQTAEDYVNKANASIAKNQYKAAVIELKNAVKLSPEDASIRFMLGKLYYETGQYGAAEKELERSLNAGYNANEVIPLLSKIYRRSGENKNLFKLAAKAKGLKPKELAQLKLYQLQAYVEAGNEKKATALIDELKRIPNGGAYSQMALVYSLILKQQLDGALTQIDTVIEQYPTQAEAQRLKGQLLLNTGQPELAAKAYEAYIESHPDDADVKFFLARLYSDLGQLDKAEPIVDQLLVDYPSQPILLQLKASSSFNQQEYKQALKFANKALDISPEDTSSRLVAGMSSYLLQDMQAANDNLSLVASLLPSDHVALRLLADAQVRLGLALDANQTINRFENLTEQDAGLMSDVGRALLRQGEINKAKAILEQQPENIVRPEVKASVAQLKLSLNDLTAILDLETALKQSQEANEETKLDQNQVEEVLANAYFINKQYDEALQLAKRWQQSDDQVQQLKGYFVEGKTQAVLGKPQLAINAYKQALVLEPNNVGIKLALIPLEHSELKLQLTAVEELLEQYPTNVSVILQHYMLGKLSKQPEQMTAHLTKQLKKSPDNLGLKVTLGKMLLLEKQPKKAVEVLESAKGKQAQSFWKNLADGYVKVKQYKKAEELYEQWFDLEPNNPQAVIGIMKIQHIQGKNDTALKIANRYLNEIGGTKIEVQLLRLYVMAELQKFSELEGALEALPANVKEMPFVHGVKGQLFINQGEMAQAKSSLLLAYADSPSPTNARNLARAIQKVDGQQALISFLTQHVEKQPSDQKNRLSLAQLLGNKQPESAKQHYYKLIEQNPAHFIAHNNLAGLLFAESNYKSAYKHALSAYELKPNEGPVLDTLGKIELKLNKNKEALTHMQAAVDSLSDQVSDKVMASYIEALLRNEQQFLAERKLKTYSYKTAQGEEDIKQIMAKYN